MSDLTVTKLRLEISPTSAQYGVQHEIGVRVLLWNFSEDPVTVNARSPPGPTGPGELLFTVVGPTGQAAPFGARVKLGRPRTADYARLALSRCVGALIDRVDYYALSEPGHYEVTVRCSRRSPGPQAPPATWSGGLQSNRVAIELG